MRSRRHLFMAIGPRLWLNSMAILLVILCSSGKDGDAQSVHKIAPGIWKIAYGHPGDHLPSTFKKAADIAALQKLGEVENPPISIKQMTFSKDDAGVLVNLKISDDERFYGLGMQTNAFEQRGMRRDIRTNSRIIGNVGFGHASMPFYISSKGYGILVNTSRYVTIYLGSHAKINKTSTQPPADANTAAAAKNTADLYRQNILPAENVNIFVGGTTGVEIYVIAGPEMKQVMQRYNLFSGGGSLPPLWGLGFKYRAKNTFNAQQVLETAKYFREHHIPCDMFGLEPGWQTHAYACSFVWNTKNFSNPDSFIHAMNLDHFKMNLWQHAYTDPSSPLFKDILPYAADYAVWKGAVPDFITPEGKRIFGDYMEKKLVDKGVMSFKLDECDAAYYDQADQEWSFPDISRFPSGLDGIQMRQLFGLLYQNTMLDIFHKKNQRTMLECRASYLFASPNNVALYSDMYDHADYIRMIANSGFAGVNWSPEVRVASSDADLIRRLQTCLMSPHMNVNCWFLDIVPWLQYDKAKNLKRELLPNHEKLEKQTKKLVELRMSLIPYLYAAFARYAFEGIPPFRALVLDYPQDQHTWKIDDQYMMGDNIMCAPFIDGASSRSVYFPEGKWVDFNNGKQYIGGRSYTLNMSLDEIPMFVKYNTILPVAKPVEYITPHTVFDITCRIYGDHPVPFQLFADNSFTNDYQKGSYTWITLSVENNQLTVDRKGHYKNHLYAIDRQAN